MRRLALFALLAACATPSVPRIPTPPPPPTRLVVLVVIDQLPSWGLEARRASYRHGLDRILREGVRFPDAIYPYANTYTAPGHAAIGTGAPPRATGILANAWYRRDQGRERTGEYDPASPVLGLDGAALAVDGASGAALRVEGLAEVLRAGGGGRSVAIAGKARAACFVAGQKPDVALWYEPAARAMTTSQAYGAVPAWAVAHAASHPASRFYYTAWGAPDPDVLARLTGGPDDGPGEGSDPVFPHSLAVDGDRAKRLRVMPFLDVVEVDAAIAAIDGEGLGQDDAVDLLAISFSAHDYVGHEWGQESWEMLDLERRLDRELGRLLDALDERVGADRYALVLTSDHGATRMPDRSGGLRIAPKAIEEAAELAAMDVVGSGDWVAAVSSAMIYASPALAAHPQRDAALAAMARAVDALPGVKQVVRLERFADGCAGLAADDDVACQSYVAGESGELYVWPDDGNLVSGYAAGTSHDPPSDDDRRVQIVVRAPGLAPRTVAGPVSALAVTATVAKLLGVKAPAQAVAPLPL